MDNRENGYNIDRLMDGNTRGLESRQGRGQMGRATISNHTVMDDPSPKWRHFS